MEEERFNTAIVQSGFSYESLNTKTTKVFEQLNKLNGSTSLDTNSTIKITINRKYHEFYLDICLLKKLIMIFRA